jgi:hypothetical protein
MLPTRVEEREQLAAAHEVSPDPRDAVDQRPVSQQ